MNSSASTRPDGGILALVHDPVLRRDVDRVAAAAGVRAVHVAEPSGPKAWAGASAVVLDVDGASRCADRDLPRRDGVLLVSRAAPDPAAWEMAISVGAQRVLLLPDQDSELVAELSEAAQRLGSDERPGSVIAVMGGSGGAGASVFATALAHAAPAALLLDVDPWSGGIDLVLGIEDGLGLRWPDVTLGTGRIDYSALTAALPSYRGVVVLSAGRAARDVDRDALAAVIDGGRRGGATVVCDLPRRMTAATSAALDVADLVALVTRADVRSCAASASAAQWLLDANPNIGLVVRGPAPGGLGSADAARITGLPVLAAMRAQPGLAAALEHGGLRPRRRSPLMVAARRVLGVLDRQRVPLRAAA